jgi:hypothetical protein
MYRLLERLLKSLCSDEKSERVGEIKTSAQPSCLNI